MPRMSFSSRPTRPLRTGPQPSSGRCRIHSGIRIVIPAVSLATLLGACTADPVGPNPHPTIPCDPGSAVPLSVGGFQQARGRAAAEFCIRGPAGGGEYVLVAFSEATPSSSHTRIRFTGENLSPSVDSPSPAPAAPLLLGNLAFGEGSPIRDPTFDAGIRSLERRELLSRVGPPGAPSPHRAPALTAEEVPAVGSLLTLNAQPGSACTDPITRTARVMAISRRALVVADTLNPSPGLGLDDYQHLAAVFDTLVVPVTDRHFGRPTDLDGNGRTILFFTQEVNRLTEEGADRFVGGFFFARDLFPRTRTPRLQACGSSNEAEILYLMVPEPGRPEDIWGRTAVLRNAPSTIAHEQQHLINAARRLHILQSPNPFEETWLSEGLSHSAEELLFYRASGLGPGSNLGLSDLQAGGSRVINAINAHHLSNIRRFERFLRAPHEHSPYDEDDSLEARGAAQQFLRYVADRRHGANAEFFRSLVDAASTGLPNLAAQLGGEVVLQEWLADWSVAIYADSRVPNLDPRHRLASWSHPSIFQQLEIPPYPIRTLPFPGGGTVEVELVGGGSTHLTFRVGESHEAVIRIVGEEPPPSSSFRVTLLRTR